MNTTTEKKPKRVKRHHSAKEKATALLTVWAGRRRAARVCRELGINWGVLNSWEKRAIRGMREALGELQGKLESETPGRMRLGARLESLLGEAPAPVTAQEIVAEPQGKP